jgi:hypothetical protein
VNLDLTRDTKVEGEQAGNYTLNHREYEFSSESQWRIRETIINGQNSSRTSTQTTPFEGAGAGVTVVMVSGSDAVSHSSYDWLNSSSGIYTEEINGSDGYHRNQSSTEDETRTTFDSIRSTQRIDGTGDTRYRGNRSLSGNGHQSHWYERIPTGDGFDVEQDSYSMEPMPDDDRPDSYDVTVDHGDDASVDLPTEYNSPSNPAANTPPAGLLGPGGFAPEEDGTEIADLKNQVASNGSAAASANAARDAAFAELAEETESSDDPGDESTVETPSAASVASTYVEGQGSLPMPGNPQEISSTVGAEAAAAGSDSTPSEKTGFLPLDLYRTASSHLNWLFGVGPEGRASREKERVRREQMTLQDRYKEVVVDKFLEWGPLSMGMAVPVPGGGFGPRGLATKSQLPGVPVLPRNPLSAPISRTTKPGTYVFVRDSDGVIHVVRDGPGLHPTVLGNGGAATAAGEITIGPNGVVTEINNISYTFQFGSDVLQGVREALQKLGLKVADDAIRPFTH